MVGTGTEVWASVTSVTTEEVQRDREHVGEILEQTLGWNVAPESWLESYLEKAEGPTRKREAEQEKLACDSVAADASVAPPENSEIELALQKGPT